MLFAELFWCPCISVSLTTDIWRASLSSHLLPALSPGSGGEGGHANVPCPFGGGNTEKQGPPRG